MAEAFQFGSRFHQNVLGDAQTSETTMRTLGAADGWLRALTHYHQQVEVTTLVRLSPCVRTEQPHLLRLKLRGEATGHFIEQVLADSFHGRNVTELTECCKPARD